MARPTSPSSGPLRGQWIIRLSDGGTSIRSFPGFVPGDIPVPADYEGKGQTDLAVYRPSTGQWIVELSTGGVITANFGDPLHRDIPVPGDYEGNGKIDLAVFRPMTDQWLIRDSSGTTVAYQLGNSADGDLPAPGNYLGNGRTDLAVFRPSTGVWTIRESNGSLLIEPFGDPAQTDFPAGSAATAEFAPSPFNPFFSPSEWSSLHIEFSQNAIASGHDVVFLGDSITYLWSDASRTPLTAQARARFVPVRGTAAWNSTFAPLAAVNYGNPRR